MEFTNVDGRQDEARVMALQDLVIDAEKPHARAVPIVWLRGELGLKPADPLVDECFGKFARTGYQPRSGQSYISVVLLDFEDPETEQLVNKELYGTYGLESGMRFTTDTDGIAELAFVGWSLDALTEEERQVVLEEMAS